MFDADLHLLCLSRGQHWEHLTEYQWSNDCHEGFSVQPYLPYGGTLIFQALLSSCIYHRSSVLNRVSPETVSQFSEDTEGVSRALARWSRADVLLLISCYAERIERYKHIKTKSKSLWEEISDELKKKGVFFNPKA